MESGRNSQRIAVDETASIMAAHSRRRKKADAQKKKMKASKLSNFLGFDGTGTLNLEPDSEDDLEDFGEKEGRNSSDNEDGLGSAGRDTKRRDNGGSGGEEDDPDDLSVHATSVWGLRVLRDGVTLVSADSLGNVQFWDARYGTLKQSFNSVLSPFVNSCRCVLYFLPFNLVVCVAPCRYSGSRSCPCPRSSHKKKWPAFFIVGNAVKGSRVCCRGRFCNC